VNVSNKTLEDELDKLILVAYIYNIFYTSLYLEVLYEF